jgi:hypothetical protein
MAVLISLCYRLHRDSYNKVHEWAVDRVFRKFESGFLQVPQLGIQFNLHLGDIIFIRSAILQHSVSLITFRKRFGTIFSSHESMFESI